MYLYFTCVVACINLQSPPHLRSSLMGDQAVDSTIYVFRLNSKKKGKQYTTNYAHLNGYDASESCIATCQKQMQFKMKLSSHTNSVITIVEF